MIVHSQLQKSSLTMGPFSEDGGFVHQQFVNWANVTKKKIPWLGILSG